MSDLFEDNNIQPMLLHRTEPFDDPDYIYELKFDGIRCLAYLGDNTTLRNKRNKDVTEIYPELRNIHTRAVKKCIVDGELVAFTDGKPDFFALQGRSLMGDPLKIKLAAKSRPISYVCYDILYLDGKDVTDKPLMERKKLLEENVKEGSGISLSRYVEKDGIAFFNLAKEQALEGVVAKKKDGLYHIGKRTSDWLKIKVMQDADVYVVGYQPDADGEVKDLILGVVEYGKLKPKGKVYLGVSAEERRYIRQFAKSNAIYTPHFPDYENVVWLPPELTGNVEYMQDTKSGNMRQPVWRGLRE